MISLFVTHVETYCVHKSLFILQNYVHNRLLDLLDLMLDGSWVETSYEIILWFIFYLFVIWGESIVISLFSTIVNFLFNTFYDLIFVYLLIYLYFYLLLFS